MPHVYRGVEFPLYQEPKTKRVKNSDLTSQSALTGTTLPWPPVATQFAYATACVQTVLMQSREANNAFNEVKKALDLPSCQILLKKAELKAPDTNKWSSKTIKKMMEKGVKSIEKGEGIRDLPWFSSAAQYKDNADLIRFNKLISEFVRVGFNRKEDLAKNRPKVLVEKAPFLFFAIVFRSIAEYCQVRLETWNKYRPDEIDKVMTGSDPTTRQERKRVRLKKRDIKERYNQLKWILLKNKLLLKYANLWYKCRVNPGTIEDYLDELDKKAQSIETSKFTNKQLKKFEAEYHPDRSNIETAISPYDEATGYPRKWRK